MLLLALDTCDSRGSMALLRDFTVQACLTHPQGQEYSSWLIPAAEAILRLGGVTHAEIEGYVVASGPGSFTGVRVGLTTVKAWSEAFDKPIASVSRLEALASLATSSAALVAAFMDAHRGQVFGGLYCRQGGELQRIEEEMVAPPSAFLDWVSTRAAAGQHIGWISLDPQILAAQPRWKEREALGERVELFSQELAPHIGRLGLRQFAAGKITTALQLDANYVRRSDAELFWKKSRS